MGYKCFFTSKNSICMSTKVRKKYLYNPLGGRGVMNFPKIFYGQGLFGLNHPKKTWFICFFEEMHNIHLFAIFYCANPQLFFDFQNFFQIFLKIKTKLYLPSSWKYQFKLIVYHWIHAIIQWFGTIKTK